MTVDIYSMVYNEEKLIQHYFDFYRAKFGKPRFRIFDNYSKDNTLQICFDNGILIEKVETNNEVRDDILLHFKNNAWKKSKADWIIVCDIDEWVDVDPFYLNSGTSHFVSEGYDMIGGPDTVYGVRNAMYDKVNVFNRRLIKDINYSVGAHIAHPEKSGITGSHRPKMYHMRYPSKEDLLARYKELAGRLSKVNKDNGWCSQYLKKEKELEDLFDKLNKEKVIVR